MKDPLLPRVPEHLDCDVYSGGVGASATNERHSNMDMLSYNDTLQNV